MKKLVPKDAILIPDNAECVFRGVLFDVYQWQQQMFDASTVTFEMLRRPDTAITIGINQDKLIIINDEQPHVGAKHGFPGGRVDPGEATILTAAKREMLEETGYTFKNWRLIQVIQPAVKIEWFVYIWVAWQVETKALSQVDAGEKITVQESLFSEVKSLVMSRVDYLGEARGIFEDLNNVKDLLALPEFEGQAVDR